MRPPKIQDMVFQQLLLVTLKAQVRSMGPGKASYLEELRTELLLALNDMVRESAAFEDISFDSEAKILEDSLANLNFIFEEVQKDHS